MLETDYGFDGHSLATATSGADYFAASDLLGTIRARANSSGSTIETDFSWPYGEFRNFGNTVSRLHFTDHLDDTETGLGYSGFRYYSSNLGRFLTPDPAGLAAASPGDPQSFNA